MSLSDALPSWEAPTRPIPGATRVTSGPEARAFNLKPPTIDLRVLEPVQSPDENLLCPICHSILISPVNLPCEHVFCGDCLRDALLHQPARSKACPSCRNPATTEMIKPASKIIIRILEDLRVKCPLTSVGCTTVVARGSVQDHMNHYCGFVMVDCPQGDCVMKVERRFVNRACLHQHMTCERCSKTTSEMDLVRHRRMSCSEAHVECSGCKELIPESTLDAHVNECMNVESSCSGLSYGCDYSGARKELPEHERLCPLRKLGPFLDLQKSRLDEHERALKHMAHKTEIYEEGLTNVQETLRDSLEDAAGFAQSSGISTNTPPFESQAAHLLDLHEALQTEVRRISTAISDLDSKLEVSILNQTLRANEEKLHRDAVEGQMRKQLQWLVSSKLQGTQRAATLIKKPTSQATVTTGPSSSTGVAGVPVDPSNHDMSIGGGSNVPIRRLSDSSRSETKL